MNNRILSVFVILLMLTILCIIDLPEDSSAANNIEGTDLFWAIEGDTLVITGSGEIPDYAPRTSPWYSYVGSISNIQFNEGLTAIGSFSFDDFPTLNSLYFPESVTRIDENAFFDSHGITDISFGDHCSVDENAFPTYTFLDNVGPIASMNDLTGRSFISVSSTNLLLSGVSIVFHSDGGTAIPTIHDFNIGDILARPTDPLKDHYVFVNWYSDRYLSSVYDFTQAVNTRLELYAKWNPLPYTITYHTYGGNTDTAANPLVYTIETPSFSLNPVSRDGYIFDGWYDAETGGNQVTDISTGSYGNIDLYAHWDATYAVRFVSEGTDYVVYNLSIGDVIPEPVGSPFKAVDSKYEYTFSRWDGYSPSMTLTTTGATFDAVFDKMIKMNKDGSSITLIDSDQSKMEFTSDRIEMIVTMANTDSELTMTVNLENCIVHFDNAALRSLKIADAELSVSKLTYDDLTPAQRKVIGNHTAYDMRFGDNTDFKGGKVSFSVQYSIEEGKNVDDLYVGYVSDGKVTEEIECDYEDGRLSFSTGHLSIYTFLYKEAKKTGFLSDLDFGSFLTIGIILAIALSGIILFVLKKLK